MQPQDLFLDKFHIVFKIILRCWSNYDNDGEMASLAIIVFNIPSTTQLDPCKNPSLKILNLYIMSLLFNHE